MNRRFLELSDAGADGIAAILGDALDRKAERQGWPKGQPDPDVPLDGHILAMVFEKSSTRTRASFDMAMRQLGGQTLVMNSADMQLGRGETVADTARVLSRYADAVMIRTDDHAKLEEFAAAATVPVINGLSDRSHPCQIVADLLTALERGATLPGSRWAWLGDGNNVLHSLVEAAGLFQFNLKIACPDGYDPDDRYLADACARLASSEASVVVGRDPRVAVAGADFVVTDSWISMGQAHAEAKLAAMAPFQVDAALMEHAGSQATFLHCLPAHRGEEVTADVIDGSRSAVWDEAENRLHAQKSILLWALGRL